MFMYSERYSDVFRNPLKPASRRRRRGLFSSGVCLQNDNARPHTARHTVKEIQALKLEVLAHPPFSPDLTLKNCHFCCPLKDALRGGDFR